MTKEQGRTLLRINHELLMLCHKYDPRDVARVCKDFAAYIERQLEIMTAHRDAPEGTT